MIVQIEDKNFKIVKVIAYVSILHQWYDGYDKLIELSNSSGKLLTVLRNIESTHVIKYYTDNNKYITEEEVQ